MPPSRSRAIGLAAALTLLASAGLAVAQTSTGMDPSASQPVRLELQGWVARPRTFTVQELKGLAPTTVELTGMAGHGDEPAEHTGAQATYTGELLWTLVDEAGLVDEPGPKTHLQHTIIAHGQDGYAVALAIGEIDPKFEGKQVIIAYEQAGKEMPSLKLVVPNDKRGGRSVKDLVSIEVR